MPFVGLNDNPSNVMALSMEYPNNTHIIPKSYTKVWVLGIGYPLYGTNFEVGIGYYPKQDKIKIFLGIGYWVLFGYKTLDPTGHDTNHVSRLSRDSNEI